MKISINIKAENTNEKLLINKAVETGEFLKLGAKPFRLSESELRFECQNSISANLLISFFLYLENELSK